MLFVGDAQPGHGTHLVYRNAVHAFQVHDADVVLRSFIRPVGGLLEGSKRGGIIFLTQIILGLLLVPAAGDKRADWIGKVGVRIRGTSRDCRSCRETKRQVQQQLFVYMQASHARLPFMSAASSSALNAIVIRGSSLLWGSTKCSIQHGNSTSKPASGAR